MSESWMKFSRWSLAALALSLLSGVCVIQLAPEPIWTGFEMLLAILLVLSLYLFYALPVWRLALIFLIGACWTALFAQYYLLQRLPENLAGHDLLITGVVSGLPDYTDKSVRFNFDVTQYLSLTDSKLKSQLPARLRLSWYHHKGKIHNGERWQLKVRLKPPHGMQNPGGFDYEKWLYQQSIHATGYVRKSQDNQRLLEAGFSIGFLREKLLSILSNLPDKTHQGLLQALTIGHKSAITQDQWQVLIQTGTSHLMAISGLHIGLIAGLFFYLVRCLVPAFICQYISASQVAALFSLIAGGFYALLAGFSVPTQRAFIMLLVFTLAILIKRPALSLNTWSLALIAVLIIDPVSVLSAGFWLSFVAVFIIMLVVSARVKSSKNKLHNWLQGMRIQWLIAISMLPLSLLLFQQGSIISPLANMIAIPLVGLVIVPLVLFASFISAFSVEAGTWLFALSSDGFSLIWALLTWLSALPFSSWQQSSVPLLEGLLAIAGFLLLLMPKGFPLRYAGVLLLLPMLLFRYPRPAAEAFWIDIIDVGQGLSVLVQTQNRTLLYDSGARFSDRFDMGRQVIVPYLNYIGIVKLDTLIISHGDNDHAGGASAVLSMLDVDKVLAESQVPKDKFNSYVTHQACEAGLRWNWDGVNFAILHPDKFYRGRKSNNRSCVLKIWNEHNSILLPGDIERKAELQLINLYPDNLDSDVLLVAHHGSNSSSASAWLEKVTPQLAVVSAGYRNRFGHPTEKIKQRYQLFNIDLLNTASSGMIMLKFSAGQSKRPIQFKQQRKVSTHYWNHRL